MAEQPPFKRKRGGSWPSGPTMILGKTVFAPHFEVEVLEPTTSWQKSWARTHFTVRYLDDNRIGLLPKDCVGPKR